MELCVANETRALGIDKEITAEPSSPSPCPLLARERGHRTAIFLPIPSALGGARTGDLPGLVVAGGPAAQFAWEEFVFVRHKHTAGFFQHPQRPVSRSDDHFALAVAIRRSGRRPWARQPASSAQDGILVP